MLDLAPFFHSPPYGWNQAEKSTRLLDAFRWLHAHHAAHCAGYRRMAMLQNPRNLLDDLADFPAVPAQIFKFHALKSVSDDEVFKVVTSSGTTGQAVSKIHLDRQTAAAQAKALAHVMTDYLGPKRRAMLIVDSPQVLRDPRMFSARGAGILGMMNFGRNHAYALKEDLSPDLDAILAFLDRHAHQPVLIFGFTFMIWQGLVQALRTLGRTAALDDAILIHGGGWKRMQEQAVDNQAFKAALRQLLGDTLKVHNFYGMVEQTGSVYVECEEGHFHVSNFSELIVRDPLSLRPLPFGRTGIIETLSVLPHSYPGHAILTEDMGEILGQDDCRCGRKGKYFQFRGRIPRAELRGCSDVYSVAE